MCQKISGPLENLKERFAYKVVISHGDENIGVFYNTKWDKKTGWSNSCIIKAFFNSTKYGYHVFKTKTGAETYRSVIYRNETKVIKVKIKGKALPFKYKRYQGYAVQYWKELT